MTASIIPNISDISFDLFISILFPEEHSTSSWYANEDEENGQGESLYDSTKFIVEGNEDCPLRKQFKGEYKGSPIEVVWVATETEPQPKTARCNGKMLIRYESTHDLLWAVNKLPYHNFGFCPKGYEYDCLGALTI